MVVTGFASIVSNSSPQNCIALTVVLENSTPSTVLTTLAEQLLHFSLQETKNKAQQMQSENNKLIFFMVSIFVI